MTLLYSSGKIHTPTAVAVWRGAIVATLRDIAERLRGPVDDPLKVHALRRAAKQARALALLAPPSLAALAQDTRDHADALRRSLGDARDAEVRRHTFRALCESTASGASGLAAVLDAPSNEEPASTPPGRLADAFAITVREWSDLDLSDIADATLADALATTYGRARKRAKKAKKGDTRELHRWRRAVVDLDLQLQPFAAEAPAIARLAKRARKMRDLLGKVNDIDALLMFLEGTDVDADALDAFRPSAAAARKLLRRKIRKGAKRTFEHGPRRWQSDLVAHLPGARQWTETSAADADDE